MSSHDADAASTFMLLGCVAQTHIYWKMFCSSCSFVILALHLCIHWDLPRNEALQLHHYVTEAIWNRTTNASKFLGYMYILGLLCILCINNSCFLWLSGLRLFCFFLFLYCSRWLCCPTLLMFPSRWQATKSSHQAFYFQALRVSLVLKVSNFNI